MRRQTLKPVRKSKAAKSKAKPARLSEDGADAPFYEKHKKNRRYGLKKVIGQAQSTVSVPILCRFWFEDGVWNGVAEDMAVAAFGSSFEEAMSNMRVAIESHLESILEAGEIEELIMHLERRAKEYGFLSLDEVSPSSPLVKMLVAIKNRELVAVT